MANFMQMAKRMQFSVVGLPHYTIWHLYEPSVDDIRHMEVGDSFLFRRCIIDCCRKWRKNVSHMKLKKRSVPTE